MCGGGKRLVRSLVPNGNSDTVVAAAAAAAAVCCCNAADDDGGVYGEITTTGVRPGKQRARFSY